jgi:predicted amino acid racemase
MAVNHFRIGKRYFSQKISTGETFKGMHNDVKLYSEIIEITEKPDTPTGELGESGIGNTYVMDDDADLGDFYARF